MQVCLQDFGEEFAKQSHVLPRLILFWSYFVKNLLHCALVPFSLVTIRLLCMSQYDGIKNMTRSLMTLLTITRYYSRTSMA